MTSSQHQALRQLAQCHGVAPSYLDATRRRRSASPDALLGVLRALGVDLSHPRQLPDRLRATRLARAQSLLEPVAVAWAGQPNDIPWQLPESEAARPLSARLHLESGQVLDCSAAWNRRTVLSSRRMEGIRYLTCQGRLPARLPLGYHRLILETASRSCETLVIAAPPRAFSPPKAARHWGLFVPLYALHSERSLGAGNFRDLDRLCAWTARQGGQVVSTLPLLPAFLDERFEPSPYSPVSRLFWNEFYLDLDSIPELNPCADARRLMQQPSWLAQAESLRQASLVDYRRQAALQRQVLEILARFFFAHGTPHRRRDFAQFRQAEPLVEDYARFRATMEKRRTAWSRWPARLRQGTLRRGDFEEAARRYHLYVQWLAHAQLSRVSRQARRRQVDLYLDMPLGVHPDGFDTWRQPDLFPRQATGGAPPDPVFTKGQDWGFPPMHPEVMRQTHYRYFLETLRHQLHHVRLLRFDHVMSLRRLYWVPRGLPASQGAYVQYPLAELCALLCLESHRHQSVIVGENLGTVPTEVNEAMRRHRLRGLYVVQYEARPHPRLALGAVPARSVASLNTHDMPPFQAFAEGLDVVDRADLGLLSPDMARQEAQQRHRLLQALAGFLRRRHRLSATARETDSLCEALLAHLAQGPAETLLVNLEDLWRETAPQNVPGTARERINWRRKTRLTLEQICQSATVRAALQRLASLRKGKR